MRDRADEPMIIDEDGKPVIDTPNAAGGSHAATGTGTAYAHGAFGAVPIPENLIGRNGKPSLWKLLGWKGTAVLVLVVAGLITLAVLSIAALVFALPIIALLVLVGWVAGKVRGRPRGTSGTGPVLVVRHRT